MLGNLVFAANPAAVEHFGAKISAQWAARFLSQIYRLEELEAIVTRLERHTDGSRNLVHYVADGKELTTTKALAWLDEHVRLGVGPALTQAVIAGAPPLPA